MATIRPLPTLSGSGTELASLLRAGPALTIDVRGGASVATRTVRSTSTSRAHLFAAAGSDRLLDPRLTHRMAESTTEMHRGAAALRVRAGIEDLEPLHIHGQGARADAERAAALMVRDDGAARAVLMSGDEQWHAGTVVLDDLVPYSDARGVIRTARVGDHGYTNSTFGLDRGGNPPIDVEPARLTTLDLGSTAFARDAGSAFRHRFSIAHDVPAEVEYRAHFDELRSLVSREGVLPLDG